MLIYRIENKESGKGPYKDKKYAYGALKMKWNTRTNRSTWQGEFGHSFDFRKKAYYAGVQSILLLQHWFSVENLIKLGELNYVLQIYESEPELISNFQVVFMKTTLVIEYVLPGNENEMNKLLNKLKGAA